MDLPLINKKVNSVQEALEGIENGMTLMLGGFGLCGIPRKLHHRTRQKRNQEPHLYFQQCRSG